MGYYKIFTDQNVLIKLFASLNDAQVYAANLGPNYNTEYYAPYKPPTLQERLDIDLAFGSQLVYVLVEDNRIMDITSEQSEVFLTKFRDILTFAQTGNIASINTHLSSILIDEVFTQDRKDKYIQMITNYLTQFKL